MIAAVEIDKNNCGDSPQTPLSLKKVTAEIALFFPNVSYDEGAWTHEDSKLKIEVVPRDASGAITTMEELHSSLAFAHCEATLALGDVCSLPLEP